MNKLFGFFLALLVAVAPVNVGRATLVSLPSPIIFPGIVGAMAGGPGFGTAATLDATGEYITYVQVAREDMVLSHVGFRVGTVANSPTVEVRIETLDASGIPSGTLWGTNTNGTSATLTTNSNPLVALTAAATITKGEAFAVKIVWGGVATSSVIVQLTNSLPMPYNSSAPYSVINTTGSAVKASLGAMGSLAFGSSATTFYYVPGFFPTTAFSGAVFNNTNSAKRGLKFTIPMKARAIGIRWLGGAAVGDYNAVLLDTSNNVLATGTFDGDVTAANSGAPLSVYFTTQATLTPGTYRVAIEPTTTTNVNVSTYTLPSSDYFSATPAGLTAVYSTFVSGTWTDSTTQLPAMDVILDQLDDGAGSGGTAPRCIGC